MSRRKKKNKAKKKFGPPVYTGDREKERIANLRKYKNWRAVIRESNTAKWVRCGGCRALVPNKATRTGSVCGKCGTPLSRATLE